MKEIWNKARERVKNKCKVCTYCNGVACAGDVPGMGGIGTGAGFQNNFKALAAWRLVMRVLHEANEPDPSLDLWGHKLALPVIAAPVGDVTANVGSNISNQEYLQSLISGCRASGTLASIGDLTDLEQFKANMNQIGDNGKHVVPFIKPWIVEAAITRLEVAADHGCGICGTDVDAAGLTILRRATTPVQVWNIKELSAFIAKAHSLKMKYIVKGVMTVDEAIIAADAGADAVVVSNHGGRVLDHTQGTAEVLPAIADAVGKRVLVMVDGGIRTGADVLKCLALGAKLTLICRPVLVVVHGDENEGVTKYFAQIRDELVQAMRLTGCADVSAVTRQAVAR